jgi:hypothetical protein
VQKRSSDAVSTRACHLSGVSRHLIAEDHIQFQDSPCGIYGGKSGAETDFSPSTLVSLMSVLFRQISTPIPSSLASYHSVNSQRCLNNTLRFFFVTDLAHNSRNFEIQYRILVKEVGTSMFCIANLVIKIRLPVELRRGEKTVGTVE